MDVERLQSILSKSRPTEEPSSLPTESVSDPGDVVTLMQLLSRKKYTNERHTP